VAIIEIPGLQEMFNVAEGGLQLWDWVIIIASTSLVMWLGEIIRWNRRRKSPVEN
jgi:Ca2+-transporting ATPase